jgi:hypothetical protein
MPDLDRNDVKTACQTIRREMLQSETFAEEVADAEGRGNPNAPLHPSDINHGWCSDFTGRVLAKLGWPAEVTEAGCIDFGYAPIHPRWGQHVWVWCQASGTHHDAEVPEGTQNWKKLPVFQRR